MREAALAQPINASLSAVTDERVGKDRVEADASEPSIGGSRSVGKHVLSFVRLSQFLRPAHVPEPRESSWSWTAVMGFTATSAATRRGSSGGGPVPSQE